MGFLRSKSRSENKAYPWLQQSFGGTAQGLVSQGQAGLGNVQNFLTGRDMTGFNQYRDSTGYQNIFNEAMRGVTSNAAARGLLNSGAMVRSAQDRAGQLAQQEYANYLQQLMGVSQAQLGAGSGLAGLITNAGNVSTQTGPVNLSAIGGLAKGIGTLVASDIRLKENIVKIGEFEDGLGVYEYTYVGEDAPQVGVMAQEVAELRPHALGPTINGYMTVDYGRL